MLDTSRFSRRLFMAGSLSLLGLSACDTKGPIAKRKVRLAGLPYGDHTQAIIGVNQRLFEKAGIELQYDTIKVEQAVPLLQSAQYDVVSVSPGLLLTAFNDAPDMQMFVFGSLFQGYAIMAQPTSKALSYSEVVNKESDPAKALEITIAQMRGMRFAYPPEGGIKPFIDLLLSTGKLSRQDFKAVVVDDAIAVATMQRGDADFQVGGAPSRITLQKAGFRPILSAVDLARSAAPSPSSPALRAVFPDGWAAKKSFIEQNGDLIAALAAVCFEINSFMKSNRTSAAATHMAYLSKVTGQQFTEQDAAIIYDELDPFLTFDEQRRWFEDASYPLNTDHVLGAQIASFQEQGLYQGRRVPTVGDISVAKQVYQQVAQKGGPRGLLNG